MKKLFVSIMAIAALAACSQEKVVEVPQDLSISFDQTFVEGTYFTTKAAAEEPAISGFNVWGFMENTNGPMFEGDEVTYQDGKWSYENLQYWAPSQNYYFAAFAPMNSKNWALSTKNANTYGPGVLSFTNVDGSEDLLYAAKSVTSPNAEVMAAVGMPSVEMTFGHLLSKVKFTFVNAFTTKNTSIVVKNIKMTAPAAGAIDLAVENWWDNDDWKLSSGTVDLAFGDVASMTNGASSTTATELMTIPADKSYVYNVTFTVELYVGDNLATSVDKTVKLTDVALNMGKGYNLRADITPENLNLLPIVFDVEEVKEWEY